MVKITDRIRIIELLEPDFFGTILNHNVVIIEKGPSGGLMLVDTSLPENYDDLEKYLKSWGYSIEDISDIIITHAHPDHFGNAERIKRESKAKIYAHEEEKFEMKKVKFEDVKKEFNNVSDVEIQKTLDRINNMKVEIPTVDVKLKGGEELGGFRVIHVPGHTKGHIALMGEGVLIVGDAIRNINGVKPPIKFFCWDYEKALRSFNYLLSLPFRILIPYHGEILHEYNAYYFI
ncbi:MBL fold metallo-hydrolase [Sulfurisphaera ohwakuensis]|uniref:Glyoxylase-like metal-dependent hydrolase (Beta-lactamase superfamily II) n=1 Tax=Sulfurisphaera ohwakuensis TaxID=69656 RepID=A0A650CHI6_SULOH|nr:MBL fold metallo-hydrolase [Sulfurisphaera ohwakuensis]MBB5255071.1 glyoxylase-like metal-dependent hydrolase (beta-lactamase superfamily II) [Sulfurisphaera ohwakuensis]QGR17260.1 MBL fold metallo-hydrolase [Sulfurisphaera ohwakuensis]